MDASSPIAHKLTFALHLLVTLLAWAGPFLFSWWLMAVAYGAVQLQFWVFGACLMNKHHGLEETNDATFYSHLFTQLGIPHRPRQVKRVVRNGLYLLLGAWAWVWQVILGHDAWLF